MGKVSTNDRQSKNRRQKRRIRNSKGTYLKSGALAQLRNSRASASKSCTDLSKKRVEVLNAKKTGGKHSEILRIKNMDISPSPLSPIGFRKIRKAASCILKAFLSVYTDYEKKIDLIFFEKVVVARQFHFNYTNPDRTRQEKLNTMTLVPTDNWPFMSKEGGQRMLITSPHTPKAPKHGPRPPSRLKFNEMR